MSLVRCRDRKKTGLGAKISLTEALNKDPLFSSKFKESMLKDKWSEVMKVIDKIIFKGEAPIIYQEQRVVLNCMRLQSSL